MRKLYIIILLVVGSFTALAQQPNGPGWKPQNTKAYQTDSSFFEKDANFNSSVRIKEGNLQIESIPVLPDATEFNILNGALVNTEEINRLVGVTSNIQTQLTARQYQDYDYYIEESGGTVYARPSPNTSLTAYSDALLSEVLNNAMGELTTGGKIFIAEGLYENNDQIIIPYDGIIIQGAGMHKTQIKIRDNYDADREMYSTANPAIYCAKANVVLKDFELDGNGANMTYIDNNNSGDGMVGRVTGISMAIGSDDAVIENVYVHDFSGAAGLYVNSDRIQVRNSHFIDNFSNQITVGLYAANSTLDNLYISGGGDVGVAIYGSFNTLRNSIVGWTTGSYGTTGSMAAITLEQHTSTEVENEGHNNSVINCQIRNPGGLDGIASYYGSRNTRIIDCDIDSITGSSTHYGLKFNRDTGLLIDNVRIRNVSDYPIYFAGVTDSYIKNCVVDNNAGTASVFLTHSTADGTVYSTNNIFSDNYINSTSGYGMMIYEHNDDNIIVNNTIGGVWADLNDAADGTIYQNNYGIKTAGYLPNTGSARAVQYTGDGVSVDFGEAYLKLTPVASPPGSPTEGTIYMDTDHHLYVYNGSTWVQLDN